MQEKRSFRPVGAPEKRRSWQNIRIEIRIMRSRTGSRAVPAQTAVRVATAGITVRAGMTETAGTMVRAGTTEAAGTMVRAGMAEMRRTGTRTAGVTEAAEDG